MKKLIFLSITLLSIVSGCANDGVTTPESSAAPNAQNKNNGCNFFEGFVDNGNGTVTDPRNGLMWQRCSVGQTFIDGTCKIKSSDGGYIQASDMEKRVSWKKAVQLARSDRTLGYDDWRLPTLNEMKSVVAVVKEGSDACFYDRTNNHGRAASLIIASGVRFRTYEGKMYLDTPHLGSYWTSSYYISNTATSPVGKDSGSVHVVSFDRGIEFDDSGYSWAESPRVNDDTTSTVYSVKLVRSNDSTAKVEFDRNVAHIMSRDPLYMASITRETYNFRKLLRGTQIPSQLPSTGSNSDSKPDTNKTSSSENVTATSVERFNTNDKGEVTYTVGCSDGSTSYMSQEPKFGWWAWGTTIFTMSDFRSNTKGMSSSAVADKACNST